MRVTALATDGLNTMDKGATVKMRTTSGVAILGNTIAVIMGTTALLSIHHRYRKQRQPNARVQDYLIGLRTQLQLLSSQSAPQLSRLQYAYKQAGGAWQHAYYSYSNNNDDANADFSAMHTTTMPVRQVQWVSGVASMPQARKLTQNKDDADDKNNFGVVGIDTDCQIAWQTTMPERVHDIVVQPFTRRLNHHTHRDVVVMGRRPSESFWVLNAATGQVQQAIKAATDRHFYGHACYSLDGTLLYVTENDTVHLVGKIGIYAVNKGYQKIAEFDAHGIGPHELIMHPDGETLIIANGGIKTEKASREELNLDTMRPSLVYLNRHDGTLLEQIIPEHNQMSVRHLAVHNDGMVVIGIQFQGEKYINVPLVLTHQRGENALKSLLMPDNQWQRFHHYIASVAVDSEHNLVCATSPFGGCAAIFDLNTRELISANSIPDCAGVSALASDNRGENQSNYQDHNKQAGFMVSDGLGQLTTLNVLNSVIDDEKKTDSLKRIVKNSKTHEMSFDNHLQRL